MSTNEVFYDGKRKLSKKVVGFDVNRHMFSVEFESGEMIPFHVDEPMYNDIHLDGELTRPGDLIRFGAAVLESTDFIEKMVKESMDAEIEKKRKGKKQ